MFFTMNFIIFWTIWIIFADKNHWREFFPVCLLASFLGLSTDVLMNYYQLWGYTGSEHSLLIIFADDLGVYVVVTYLFIQWLPIQRTPRKMLAYWFAWTTFTIFVEKIYSVTGHMYYQQWWTSWHSYFADWFLFWVFYKFHEILYLERLSPQKSLKPSCRTPKKTKLPKD